MFMFQSGHEKLGTYLREKRATRGISQSDVAKKLGYTSAQFISNIERGLCSPPMSALRDLVDLYKIPKQEIFDFLMEIKKDEFKSGIYGANRRAAAKKPRSH
jgi:transcriptional regulator with XRE-family HTH domain